MPSSATRSSGTVYALSGTGRSPNRSAEVGTRDNLRRWLGLLESLDCGGVRRALARWPPFQGLVYLHLLLGSLQPESPCCTDPARIELHQFHSENWALKKAKLNQRL